MKRQLWITAAAVSLLSFAARAQEPAKPAEPAAAPGGTPKIQLDKTVYDFGSTSMVQQLAGKFIITNAGDAPLEKLKAQPSCGCTSAPLKTDKLAPGESTELAFTLNIGTPRGHVEKHIMLSSSDPKQPSVNLTLKADIVPILDANPATLNLGNLRIGSTTNITVQLKRIDGKPLGALRAEAGQSMVSAKVEPVEGSTDAAQLLVTVEAKDPARYINDNVRLYLGDAQQPVTMLPVSSRFVGDITANPEGQFWGIADPENWPGGHPEQQQRKFSIVSNKPDAKLEIKKATTELSDVTLDVKPVEEGKSYEITVTLDKAPKQSERGSVKVETNMGNLELGITVNVLKRS